jgi:putative Ca2+/H+ antiporter (TMEM165/GDT1 family)
MMDFTLVNTYVRVLVPELDADPTFCATGSVAARYRPWPVVWGMSGAFMLRMLLAVVLGSLFGQQLERLPEEAARAGALVSAGTFGYLAWRLWRGPAPASPAAGAPAETRHAARHAAATSFGAIFCAELLDISLVTTFFLASGSTSPALIWLGATLAMMTKGLLAITLGGAARKWLPEKTLRYAAVAVCLVMGLEMGARAWRPETEGPARTPARAEIGARDRDR